MHKVGTTDIFKKLLMYTFQMREHDHGDRPRVHQVGS